MVDFKKHLNLKLSASSMDTLAACGLRFRFRYVEYMKEEGFSAAGAFGTAFHKVAQLMYEMKEFDRRWMLAQWPDIFDQVFADPNLEKLSDDQRKGFRSAGYPVLNMFFSKEDRDGMLKPAIGLEKRFEIPYKQLKDGRDVLLIGSIDRIIGGDNGDVEITDYKTSKSQPMSSEDLLQTIQMPLYSLAYRYLNRNDPKNFPISNHYINMFYVRHNDKVIAHVKKEHRILLKEKIDKSIQRILDKDFKPKRDDDNWNACKGCTFKKHCPAFGNKLPDFEKLRDERKAKEESLKPGNIKLGRLKKPILANGKKIEITDKQIEDVSQMSKNKFTLNSNQVGTGKTVESIALAEHLRETEGATKILLLLPKTLRGQWKEKIREWSDVGSEIRTVKDVHFSKRATYYGERFWTIANYDKVLSDNEAIRKIDWDLLICDECQRLAGTSKSANMIRLIRAKRKVALTATPIGSRLDKLFRIMAFVKPGTLGSWTEFKKRYFVYDKSGVLTGFKNLLEVRERLGVHFIRRTKREIFPNAKEPMIEPVFIDMSSRQKALYRENLEELQEMLKKGRLNETKTVNFLDTPEGHKWIKLRRMLSFTHLIDGGKFDSPKYDYVKELVEDILDADEKIIIFSQYLTVLKALKEKMIKDGFKNILEISGGDKQDRDEVRHLVNKSKKHNILLMSDAGKFGYNFDAVNNMINMELPEDPDVITQRVGRIARPEQLRDMNVWNLVMKKTFEVKILKRRYLRAQVSSIVVDGSLKKDVVDLRETRLLNAKSLKEILI